MALEMVFEPFSQADTSVTRRFGGTGLGLAICRQLTEALGGGVTAKSKLGKGSTFTMTVATGSLEGVAIGAVDSLYQDCLEDAPAELKLPPCRVLAVDDNEVNRNLIKLILTRAGAEVAVAENGQVAVDQATSSPFDIVLMDMQMPVLDGYAATRKLRELGMTLPIVALTAHAMRGDEAKCRTAGCSGFLTKPLQMDLVIESIQQLIRQHGTLVEADGRTGQQHDGKAATMPVIDDEEIEEIESALCELAEISSEVSSAPPSVEGTDVEAESPIESLLPTADPDFREIVELFIERFAVQLDEMRAAFQQGDYEELSILAHTVKGSGGSAGFPACTEPAAELERLAIAEKADKIEAAIDRLERLQRRFKAPVSSAF
jgi:CheY-like chemotaxis protein/HPt (histidine-containing phosphotransfer) domain-containing protein